MATTAEIAERWIANAVGTNDRPLNPRSNVYYREDTIFSYGEHFPMGIVLRDLPPREEMVPRYRSNSSVRTQGAPRLIVLNGDSYSPSTTQHQANARSAAQGSGLPIIIVPFTALSAADIDVRTIEPIEVRNDRIETITHTQTETPKGEPIAAYIKNAATGTWETSEPDPNRRHLHANGGPVAEWNEVSENWVWETTRHWLGDCAFFARGRFDRTRRRFLSSFDYQEARPLYFLCELPRTGPISTIEQAYELLKPSWVKLAETGGKEVTRQGDMFAIPTELTTRELKARHTPYGKGRIVKRPRFGLLDTNHTASEVIFATGERVYARGLLYHLPQGGRAPDHARRKMGDGKTWHLLTRNTVPRQRAANPQREEIAA